DEGDLAALEEYLRGGEVHIGVDLGIADGDWTVYGCDLSGGYVRLNADYTTCAPRGLAPPDAASGASRSRGARRSQPPAVTRTHRRCGARRTPRRPRPTRRAPRPGRRPRPTRSAQRPACGRSVVRVPVGRRPRRPRTLPGRPRAGGGAPHPCRAPG